MPFLDKIELIRFTESVVDAVLQTVVTAAGDDSSDSEDESDEMILSDVNTLLSDFIPHEEGALSADLFDMLRENMLVVEGIKIDNEPALYALAITVSHLKDTFSCFL